jgi:hypothetical protein
VFSVSCAQGKWNGMSRLRSYADVALRIYKTNRNGKLTKSMKCRLKHRMSNYLPSSFAVSVQASVSQTPGRGPVPALASIIPARERPEETTICYKIS